MEEDFVKINADDDITIHTTSSNTSYQSQDQYPSHSKHHSLSVSKTNAAYGHQTDVLALLLSSVTSKSTSTSTSTSTSPPSLDGMRELCQRAATKAQEASKATRDGNLNLAARDHLEASKCYRDAALLLKNEYNHKEEIENVVDNDNTISENVEEMGAGQAQTQGTWSGDVKFLAYSLLMLSNSQARSADCLVKSGSVSVNLGAIVKNDDNGNGNDDRNGNGNGKEAVEGRDDKHEGENGTHVGGSSRRMKTGKRFSAGKEDRLRAKIRASMDTAEADMTDSTFLGKATSISQPMLANANANVQERTQSLSLVESATVQAQGQTSNFNPVDDMMELEQELRDMDATLNMGVNLSSSTSSIMTKKSLEDGSFCVVPGSGAGASGSSFMSSSMMWASGIGGGRHAQPHGHLHGRARANRVRTILDASSAGMHKSTSVGTHQIHQNPHLISNVQSTKHHQGLESSWWGQASALASSTTSLSNSMVGVRSGNQIHTNGTVASPANTKQLMRLLDSLKTLGDENSSLLREVEDAKKSRIEAKAARESMKQFKAEYNKRFDTLKAALDKVRSEQPNQKGNDGSNGGIAGNNVVSRSNFVKSKALTEVQKRDKMIQKLAADLMAEKAESKKKDDSLRKYENFYKEVKHRSEMKKRQKEEERNPRRKNQR
jgi:hypothetical protein